MQSLEVIKVSISGNLFVRTKDDKLAYDYYVGKIFLDYKGKTYYCEVYTKTVDGWNIMRMGTHE